MISKKMYTTLLAVALAGISNFAMADNAGKFAIIDVPQVVNSSAQFKALRKEQETKIDELQKFIAKARKDVAGTTDVKKKQSLEEKYNKELISKRDAISKTNEEKLMQIDKKISEEISKYAKAQGYDIVLVKGTVLYGGDDITEEIIKIVK